MTVDAGIRDLLSRALSWGDAHVSFDDAVEGLAPPLRGVRPAGVPHSAWELLEHLRITQSDILEFCVRADYQEKTWPDDYWPASPVPPSDDAWQSSVAAYQKDREALQKLAKSPEIDLDATIPHGSGQTYGRELVLVIDHSAYHLAQLVLVRQLLGAWR
jgi:hypothetical protein